MDKLSDFGFYDRTHQKTDRHDDGKNKYICNYFLELTPCDDKIGQWLYDIRDPVK
ncbi:MAG: hypothetical protein P8X85_22975 [Desulfobacterales bacterium]